jgi:predicted Zn-dependent peptidase
MYTLTHLDNGLQVLTVPMPQVQSVSLGFFMGVGSRYENQALSGASHFIEHMLFKGTGRHPTARDIAEAIEGKGGICNASTGLESTLYWAKVAADHLPETLNVLSGMLLDATFDPFELEKERAVIGEEISYTLDRPDSLVQLLANELQWPGHPLGRDIAGTKESVAGLNRASLLAFMQSHYRPGRTILGLAGQITHDQALRLVGQHLQSWEPGPEPGYEPAPANHDGPRLHVQYRDVEQAHLTLSFSGLSRSHPDRQALRLLNVLLGEGMRSRLFQQVREELGLAYSVDSYVSTLQDTGAVGIYAGVTANRVEESIAAILEQLNLLRQEPVPLDELDRAREFVKGRMALSLEDSFSIAAWYARQQLLGPEVLDPEDVIARFEEIEQADIQRVAQSLFRPERLNLAIVGPFAENGDRFREVMHF